MPVDDDVHFVFLENAHVNFAPPGIRCAEENILQFGSKHRTAPAVGQSHPAGVLEDVLIVLVHAHCASMQRLCHFPVHCSGCNFQLVPYFLARARGAAGHKLCSFCLAEFPQGNVPYIQCDIGNRAVFRLYAQLLGKFEQLRFVLKLIITGFAFCGSDKNFCHRSAVIAVCAYTCRYRSEKIACHNRIHIGAANTIFRLLGYPAWPHSTNPAANALFAEAALWMLQFEPVPGILLTGFGHAGYHFLCRFIATAFFRIHKTPHFK